MVRYFTATPSLLLYQSPGNLLPIAVMITTTKVGGVLFGLHVPLSAHHEESQKRNSRQESGGRTKAEAAGNTAHCLQGTPLTVWSYGLHTLLFYTTLAQSGNAYSRLPSPYLSFIK